MVALALPNPDLIEHDDRVREMHRADKTFPDVETDTVMVGFESLNKAMAQLRGQIQQLQGLHDVSSAAQYKKEQLLHAAHTLEQSAQEARQEKKHNKGLIVAGNAHQLSDQINVLLAQAA